jgi:hypothetical protein
MKKVKSSLGPGSYPLTPTSFMNTFLHSRATMSLSSFGMRPGISPVASILLSASRKVSDLMSESVIMKPT